METKKISAVTLVNSDARPDECAVRLKIIDSRLTDYPYANESILLDYYVNELTILFYTISEMKDQGKHVLLTVLMSTDFRSRYIVNNSQWISRDTKGSDMPGILANIINPKNQTNKNGKENNQSR